MPPGVVALVLAFGLSAVTRLALPASRHAIQAGFDVAAQSMRDDSLVPLAHTGLHLAVAPRYFGDFGRELLLADASLGMGYVVGRFGEMGLTFTWRVGASPLFRAYESARAAVFVGPTFALDNETFFFGDWDDAHTYWIGARWIGPRAHGWRWLGGRWRLDFDGQFALFGALSRPPALRLHKQETSWNVPRFYSWPLDDPSFGWLADFQLVRAAVDFYRTRSRARVPTGFGIGGEFAFTRAVEPAPAFSARLTCRLSYTWGL